MNIALCADEKFSIPALVCIVSIFENNKDEDCHVYVLTDGFSTKTKDKFDKLSSIYGRKIDIIQIDKHRFDGLVICDRFPVSMYYRFLLPEFLKTENKVLYLDCDIIVRQSLKKMYDTELGANAVGAVVSQSCDWVKWANELCLSTPFFNSGVMLLNLEYWRENDIFNKLVKWIHENPDELWLPDQCALNKVLDGFVVYLGYTYNFQERWTYSLKGSYMHYSRWNDIYQAGQNPVIVHFCEAVKPWFFECQNCFKQDFLKYAFMYDFISFKLIRRYDKVYYIASFLDKIGLKLRYLAEIIQKKRLKRIKIC